MGACVCEWVWMWPWPTHGGAGERQPLLNAPRADGERLLVAHRQLYLILFDRLVANVNATIAPRHAHAAQPHARPPPRAVEASLARGSGRSDAHCRWCWRPPHAGWTRVVAAAAAAGSALGRVGHRPRGACSAACG